MSVSSGQIKNTIKATSGYYYYLAVDWVENSIDIANNTSNVTLTLKTWSNPGNSYNLSEATTVSISVDRSEVATNSLYVDYRSHNGEVNALVLKTWTSNITHDIYGNKSISVDASMEYPGGGTALVRGTYTVSGSATLSNIASATIPTFSATSVELGSSVLINLPSTSNSFKHSLTYSFGSLSGQTSGIATPTNVQTSSVFVPPLVLAEQIPNSETGTCTVECKTYNGATLIGTKTATITLKVPDNIGPTVENGWITVTYDNLDTSASAISAYVKGYSKAKATFNIAHIAAYSTAYHATIMSCKIVYGSSVETALLDNSHPTPELRTPIISTAGNQYISCYVYDSRGHFYKQDITFNVNDYFSPTLSDVLIFRCDQNGIENEEGTYISVKGTATVSSINGLNQMTLQAKYGTVGGSLSSPIALTSGAASIIGGGAISTATTYNVQIELIDLITAIQPFVQIISSSSVAFNLRDGGKGAAFGKYAEADKELQMPEDWSVKFGNQYLDDYIVDKSAIGTWKCRKYANGYAECYKKLSLSNVACNIATGGVYRSLDNATYFPTDFFNNTPEYVNVQLCGSTNNGYIIGTRIDNVNKNQFSLMLFSTMSDTKSVDMFIEAKGTWK